MAMVFQFGSTMLCSCLEITPFLTRSVISCLMSKCVASVLVLCSSIALVMSTCTCSNSAFVSSTILSSSCIIELEVSTIGLTKACFNCSAGICGLFGNAMTELALILFFCFCGCFIYRHVISPLCFCL